MFDATPPSDRVDDFSPFDWPDVCARIPSDKDLQRAEGSGRIVLSGSDKRTRVMDAKGNTVAFDATAIVDMTIPIGSRMWLGVLQDWYASGSAGVPDELMEVKYYYRTPAMREEASRRSVGLMRLHD